VPLGVRPVGPSTLRRREREEDFDGDFTELSRGSQAAHATRSGLLEELPQLPHYAKL